MHLGKRGVAVLVAVGLLVLGGGVIAYLWLRDTTRPVTVDEARTRFDRDHPDGPGTGSVLRPAEGVYTYRGSGSEHISTPPKSQDEGPGMPGTVTHARDGCWTFRIDYSTNHWQDWDYCATDGTLREHGGHVFQRWDFAVTAIDNITTFDCTPALTTIRPAMAPGDTWRQSCHGTNDQIAGTVVSAGPYRFVGTERLTISGERVEAFHFTQRRTVTGAQTGTARSDVWFGRDGLPLRNQRRIEVDSDSPIGKITYTEQGNFALTSLRAQA